MKLLVMEKGGKNEFRDLRWLERTAHLLDSQFRIPGTNFKFGLDPIIGLIPVLGDASTLIISAVMVLYMARYGVSGKVLVVMVLNIVLDAVVGGIPVLGSIFDFVYKANDKNIRLLKEHYHEGKHQGSGMWIIITVLIFFVTLFVLLMIGLYQLFKFLFGLF
jgi:hypothetical protein